MIQRSQSPHSSERPSLEDAIYSKFRHLLFAIPVASSACSAKNPAYNSDRPENTTDVAEIDTGEMEADSSGGPGRACGNGILDVEIEEECDGENLGGMDCFDVLQNTQEGGILACLDNCRFDTSACLASCGDGIAEGNEACDGEDVKELTCGDVIEGSEGGILTCTIECELDLSGCMDCGNNTINPGEQCDGTDLNGNTCQNTGHLPGQMSCQNCILDPSTCGATCGNETLEGDEECDGSNLNGLTCTMLDQLPGVLLCNNDCSVNPSECGDTCGNDIIEGDEVCDGTDLDDQTCNNLGLPNGTLSCNDDCSDFYTEDCTG